MAETTPHRVQLRRIKGWKLPESTVIVSRGPGRKWGNPFRVCDLLDLGARGTDAQLAARCVVAFESWLDGHDFDWMAPESNAARDRMLLCLPDLRGKNLACWCSLDQPCHADVLLRLANEGEP
jgi:hypothetical protein